MPQIRYGPTPCRDRGGRTKRRPALLKRAAHEIVGAAINARKLKDQRHLDDLLKTVRDDPRRNDPATRRMETGKIWGIRSRKVHCLWSAPKKNLARSTSAHRPTCALKAFGKPRAIDPDQGRLPAARSEAKRAAASTRALAILVRRIAATSKASTEVSLPIQRLWRDAMDCALLFLSRHLRTGRVGG